MSVSYTHLDVYKRQMLSDLRESGAIEQDADIVMMLYRESYYNEEAKEQAKESGTERLEINLAKHRNGATGRVLSLIHIFGNSLGNNVCVGQRDSTRLMVDTWVT